MHLDDLGVRAGGQQEARRGVPEGVQGDAAQTGAQVKDRMPRAERWIPPTPTTSTSDCPDSRSRGLSPARRRQVTA